MADDYVLSVLHDGGHGEHRGRDDLASPPKVWARRKTQKEMGHSEDEGTKTCWEVESQVIIKFGVFSGVKYIIF